MDIDEQLISRNSDNDEAEKAGEFRERQRGGNTEEQVSEATSLRERVQQKKRQEAEKEKSLEGQKSSASNPMLAATDKLLQAAWENLAASWGLTLIWIDIHVFLNKVFGPSAFRELGEEWVPDQIRKLSPEKAKSAAAMMRVVEQGGCGCLNLGCLFIIIAILSLIALIVQAFSGNPLETIKTIFESLWSYFKGGK